MTLIRRQSIPAFFDDFFTKELNQLAQHQSTTLTPATNIKEDDNQFTLEVILPGVEKENIQLDIENNHLSIVGKIEKDAEDEHYVQKEFRAQSFERKFVLPKNVQKESVSAMHQNGVLKVIILKETEEEIRTKINIQ